MYMWQSTSSMRARQHVDRFNERLRICRAQLRMRSPLLPGHTFDIYDAFFQSDYARAHDASFHHEPVSPPDDDWETMPPLLTPPEGYAPIAFEEAPDDPITPPEKEAPDDSEVAETAAEADRVDQAYHLAAEAIGQHEILLQRQNEILLQDLQDLQEILRQGDRKRKEMEQKIDKGPDRMQKNNKRENEQ